MEHRYLYLTKNMIIAGAAALAAGAGAAELSSLVTDNKTITSAISTVAEYVSFYSAFFPLYA